MTVPSDVDFKSISTAVKGPILIVSAEKVKNQEKQSKQEPQTSTSSSYSSSTPLQDRRSGFGDTFGSFGRDKSSFFESPLLKRSDTGFGSDSIFNSPRLASFPREGTSTYEVTVNDDEKFEAKVPLPEFKNNPEKVTVDMYGHTVKLKAQMEIRGSDGNTRISKIFRDITLPNECDTKSLEANWIGSSMIIKAKKHGIDKNDMIPFNQRDKPDFIDDGFNDSPRLISILCYS